MTVAEGKLIQVMSTAATKWNGIRAMLEAAGIHNREAIYFGDDYDDIEAIKNCGTGVAVSNAIAEALAVDVQWNEAEKKVILQLPQK